MTRARKHITYEAPRDYLGQRTEPDDVGGSDYCKRHMRIVSAEFGCEQCQHESEADND